MGDLTLVRLHEDGEHLVLAATDGTRFMLPITEELRAAVRRDRAHMEHLRAENVALSPREIQSRLRAGQTVGAVAGAAGVPVDQVERYAGPVLAEQEYVLEQVRAGTHGGSEPLNTLVSRRLEARAADPEAVVWSATREGASPWLVTALFEVAGSARTAQWTYRVASRSLTAIDDEARWLQVDEPEQPTQLDGLFDQAGGRVPAAPAPSHETDNLLEELSSRRGLRSASPERPAAAGDDLPFEDFDPPLIIDFDPVGADVVAFARRGERGQSHPAAAGGDQTEKSPTPVPDDDTEVVERPSTERRSTRKGRAKVPSLDEIVFGAKPRT